MPGGNRELRLPEVNNDSRDTRILFGMPAVSSSVDLQLRGLVMAEGVTIRSIGFYVLDFYNRYPRDNVLATLMMCEHCFVWNTHLP